MKIIAQRSIAGFTITREFDSVGHCVEIFTIEIFNRCNLWAKTSNPAKYSAENLAESGETLPIILRHLRLPWTLNGSETLVSEKTSPRITSIYKTFLNPPNSNAPHHRGLSNSPSTRQGFHTAKGIPPFNPTMRSSTHGRPLVACLLEASAHQRVRDKWYLDSQLGSGYPWPFASSRALIAC